MTKTEHRRRYKLHYKVKSIVSLMPRKRTMSVPCGYEPTNMYVLELINRFHYSLQFHIPIPDVNEIEVNNPIIIKN